MVGPATAALEPGHAKATELKAFRSDIFWDGPSFAALDAMRVALRDVMPLAETPVLPPPALVTHLDLREDEAEFHVDLRATSIKSIDFSIYRRAVQSALEPLFESDPVLQKVRRGEVITEEELDKLNSLLHTRNPNVDLSTLREFFPDTAVSVTRILRSIVGLEHEAAEAKFTAFAQTHALNSQQLRFLVMLKDHIRNFGAIATDKLFDAPFTSIHTEGLGGVFPNNVQFEELVRLVRDFGEPLVPPASAL